MSEWQLIESAPKDETEILIAGGGYGCEETGHEFYANGFDGVAHVTYWDHAFRRVGDYNDYFKPTHWMPLPEPPKERG